MGLELEVMRRANELLSNGISRGAYARGLDGEPVGTMSPGAYSFCSVGAIARAHHDITGEWSDELRYMWRLLAPYTSTRNEGKITQWHDHASDTEVLHAFASALAVLEAEQIVEEGSKAWPQVTSDARSSTTPPRETRSVG
jgi:hypothetical protein